MRGYRWLVVMALAPVGVLGQGGFAPESEAITKALEQLNATPMGVKQKQASDALQEAYTKQNKEREELYAKLRALQESPEGREYARKYNELMGRRNQTWEKERKALAEAARKLYQERHATLQPLAAGPLTEVGRLGLDLLSYPRVDGSTSTHPLSVVVAARVLGTEYEWTYSEPQGSPWGGRRTVDMNAYLPMPASAAMNLGDTEFSLASARLLARPAGREQDRLARIINTYLATSANTHNAYLRLINGECDLNLTVRGPSDDEQAAAKAKGVEIALIPVAQDALVFMVRKDSGATSLTRDEIRSIYNGETKRWNIRPLWREPNSGSREIFDALVGADKPEWEKPHDSIPGHLGAGGMLYATGMAGPYNQLLQDPRGLGYSFWYYDQYMAMSPQTRIIAIDGIEPTRETIASGKYPLVTKVYAACRKDEPESSPTRRLIRWMLSAEGQRVVQESGYVPLRP